MKNKWISVNDKLPPFELIVLGFGYGKIDKIKTWDFCQITKKGFKMFSAKNIEITHWQLLTEPTKP